MSNTKQEARLSMRCELQDMLDRYRHACHEADMGDTYFAEEVRDLVWDISHGKIKLGVQANERDKCSA